LLQIFFFTLISIFDPKVSMLSSVVGIVSGGSSGLGAATVRCLLRSGAKVVVADLPNSRDNFFQLAQGEGIDSSRIAEGIAGISAANSPLLAFAETDVTKPEQVAGALDLAEAAFGEHVNAAISCAGIGIAKKTLSRKRGSEDPPSAHPLEMFSNVINVNLVGTFNVASLAAERMARREPGKDGARGCIVNTASVAAYDGQRGQIAYAASKGGVVALTLPMARDLAEHGIRVMTIVSGSLRVVSTLFRVVV
jgi:3-hydroxyacyl-CoA dehydrogenase/3-hydroxy-2-methylbutyryl-CoA dehydrogenase